MRKFYNMDGGEFAGASFADFKIIQPGAEPQVFDSPADVATTPVESTTEPDNAAAPAEPSVIAPVTQLPKEPVQTKVEAPVAPLPEPVQKSWEDGLRENGFDDFDIDLLKYRKATGDVTPYLEAKSVDFKSMSPEEVMKYDLRKQYPNASQEAFDLLYREEVVDKYKLDPDMQYDKAVVELGKLKLQRDADTRRAQYLEQQTKFKAPERQPDDTARKQQEAYEQQVKAQAEAFKQTVTTNTATQQLLNSKKLVFDGGEEGMQFNFEADNPNELVDVILDGTKYQQLMTKPDGSPDVQKMLLLSAVAKNPQLVIRNLINYGKSLGTKSLENELVNPSRTGNVTPITTEESFGQAMLNRGIRSWRNN